MSWVYDGFGNRTAQNVVKGSVPVQSIDVDMNTNRVTSWSYDANGNATSIPGVGTITYDASNRVKTVGGETYEYDPSNKRTWKNDTFTFWGGKGERVGTYSVTLMSDTTGSPTQWKLAFVKQTEDWYFGGRRLNQVQDRLGSVRRDSSLTSQSYYPYGEERTSTANPADKFATYHRDGTGLDYADQRYYASSSGRFISSDPYQASPSANVPASWNRFIYANGDPASFIDPTGLVSTTHVGSGACTVGTGEGLEVVECDYFVVDFDTPQPSVVSGEPRRPLIDPCDRSNPSNNRIIEFIHARRDDAKRIQDALKFFDPKTDRWSTVPWEFILAWSAQESGNGNDRVARGNNNYFGLVTDNWRSAIPCPSPLPASYEPGHACFAATDAYFVSGMSALTSGTTRYGFILNEAFLQYGLDFKRLGDALHRAGYNAFSHYGSRIQASWDSISARLNCL